MESRTDLPRFWPLVEGSLTGATLESFAPINCTAALQAFELGFLNVAALRELVHENLLSRESEQLRCYVDSATFLDRRRDIKQELEQLAAAEGELFRPLWMILARMILKAYSRPDEAVETLEQLYEFADFPADLRAFTLYGSPTIEDGSTTKETTEKLDAFLKWAGV